MPRPGFSFLVCPDAALIRREIDRLLAAEPGGWEKRVYWGDEELPAAFWQDLTIPGLMASAKAVVVRRAHNLSAETWDKLSSPLRGANDRVWPFFCLEGSWEYDRQTRTSGPKIPKWIQRQKYWEVAEKRNFVWRSPGLTPQTAPEFLKRWARERGLTVEPGAASAFAQVLPLDATAARLALDKAELALPAGETRITAEAAALVGEEQGPDIFQLLSSFESGALDVKAWRTVLDSQAAGEELLFPFLALLLREARAMWRLAHGEGHAVSMPPRSRAAKEALAERLGGRRLAAMWELAMEAEHGVKSGSRSPGQAMEILVAGLCELFRRPEHPGQASRRTGK